MQAVNHMGVINYAVNHQTREYYELGKGCWFDIADIQDDDTAEPTSWIQPQPELAARVTGVITSDGFKLPEEMVAPYAQEIADALVALAHGERLELITDCSWRWPIEGYRLIGSRYHET